MSERILILGAGGHGRVVLETLLQHHDAADLGIVDPKLSADGELLGVPVVGVDADLPRLFAKGWQQAVLGVGAIMPTDAREGLVQTCKKIGFRFPVIIDDHALVSPTAMVGEGTYIGRQAVLQAGVSVGAFCILNTGCIVEHDCNVGDFTHIAPGAILLGAVSIGSHTLVGGGSVVRPLQHIGTRVVIGAGSIVLTNIPDNVVAYGNPCLVGGKK